MSGQPPRSVLAEPFEQAVTRLKHLLQTNSLSDAAALAQTLAQAYPQAPIVRTILGVVERKRGNWPAAEAAFQYALALAPSDPDTHYNYANGLLGEMRCADALTHYRTCLTAQPRHFRAWNNLGHTYSMVSDYVAAIGAYHRALAIEPQFADALNNLGGALVKIGHSDDALAVLDQCLTLVPRHAQAWNNRGWALFNLERYDEASQAFQQSIQLDPQLEIARTNLLTALDHLCDWPAIRRLVPMAETLGLGSQPAPPWAMLPHDPSPMSQRRRAEIFARSGFGMARAPLPAAPHRADSRLQIGYFSADFHDHATMHLMAGVFREHDRQRFAIHAFSFGKYRDGSLRADLIRQCDSFHDVEAMTFDQILMLARDLRLDLAVDLKGYTQYARTGLFAAGLAPVQVQYLGYPGTMGADFIDYIAVDRFVVPDIHRQAYTEHLMILPDCYQSTDNQRPIAAISGSRTDHALPETGFVFACFNACFKIGEAEFTIWMRLLAAVPGSVMWLRSATTAACNNLRNAASRLGIDPDRLIFAPFAPNSEHLARLAHADLVLDTFLYNAHTTANDALWAGVPMITLVGQTFAARVGGSLLHAAGLPDLVTDTPADYEALALALAHDPARLAEVRARTAAARHTSALFDTIRFTRHWEAGLAAAIARSRAGLVPDTIIVDAVGD